ncbi:choice-of-anchor D domain-containing protein [bacterium]|nr:choice-of-anchor D domain-containing protein [bacterium]
MTNVSTRYSRVLAALCAVVLGAATSFAQVHVAPGGVDSGDGRDPGAPVGTIAYALTQASDGEEIRLAEGTYNEQGLLLTQSQMITGGWLSDFSGLNSPVDPANTVVQGDGSDRIIRLTITSSGRLTTLDGFTITGGDASTPDHGTGFGGGVYAPGSGKLVLNNMTFDGNAGRTTKDPNSFDDALGHGGAVYSDGSLVISNSMFSNNVGNSGGDFFNDSGVGGAVYYGYSGSGLTEFLIADTTFDSNIGHNSDSTSDLATATSYGGAVAIFPGSVSRADDRGGLTTPTLTFQNVDFLDNSSRGFDADEGNSYGGGLYIDLSSFNGPIDVKISDSRFLRNYASNAFTGFVIIGGFATGGGAAFITNAQTRVLIEDTEFDSNVADERQGLSIASGGGFYAKGPSTGMRSHVDEPRLPVIVLNRTTICNNRAGNSNEQAGGGGFHVDHVTAILHDSKFCRNQNRSEAPFNASGDDGRHVLAVSSQLLVENTCFSNALKYDDSPPPPRGGPPVLGWDVYLSGNGETSEFRYCTFAEALQRDQEALYVDDGTDVIVDSSIFSGFTVPIQTVGSGQALVRYTVYDSADLGAGTIADGGSNLAIPPGSDIFRDLPNDDLHLIANAPAIGAGNPANAPEKDADGDLRDAQPDAGCDEYVVVPEPMIEVTEFSSGNPVTHNSTVDLGKTPLNGPNIRVSFNIKNTGTGTLSVSSISITGDLGLISTAPFQLAPEESKTFDVGHPSNPTGVYNGQVTIVSDAVNNTEFIFNATAEVTEPEIALFEGDREFENNDPLSSVFMDADLNGTPTEKTYTIKNLGTGTLNISQLAVSLPYTFLSGTPSSVAPMSEEQFTVRLPTDVAGRYDGTLEITSDDQDEGLFVIKITGRVIAPEMYVEVDNQPIQSGDTVDFGAAAYASEFPTKTVTIGNTGNTTLELDGETSPTIPDVPIAILAAEVPPGEETSFTLKLKTAEPGAKEGTVRIFSNDPEDNPFEIKVTGTIGDLPNEPEYDFGDAIDPTFPTLLASDGARHKKKTTGPNPKIGANATDYEFDGRPGNLALGDDSGAPIRRGSTSDDEDSITPNFVGQDCYAGQILLDRDAMNTFHVVVGGSAGFLYFWLDLNGDGDWDDAGEQLVKQKPVNVGDNVAIPIPIGANFPRNREMFGRLRISTDLIALKPTGAAVDGEVEDYLFRTVDRRFLAIDTTDDKRDYKTTFQFRVTNIVDNLTRGVSDVLVTTEFFVFRPGSTASAGPLTYFNLTGSPQGYSTSTMQWTIPAIADLGEAFGIFDWELQQGFQGQNLALRIEVVSEIECNGISDEVPGNNKSNWSIFLLFGDFADRQQIIRKLLEIQTGMRGAVAHDPMDPNEDAVVDVADLIWAVGAEESAGAGIP